MSTSRDPKTNSPSVALVLGAGGIVGASYLAGALEGIRRATGFEPFHADLVLGTSAGAFIGAISAVGIPTALMYARCTGDTPDGQAFSHAMIALGERMDRHNEGSFLRRYLPDVRVPRLLLSSPRLAFDALRDLRSARFELFATGLLGEGVLSTQRSIGGVIRTALPAGWPTTRIWVATYNLDTCRRVVFGRSVAQSVDLHVAVSAATAIPSVFAPVIINGARHCDAGIASAANLDLLGDLEFDAVICINPLSGGKEPILEARGAVWRSQQRIERLARARADRQLESERALVERSGTKVYVLHPTAADIADFPLNSMNLMSRASVMRKAAQTTYERLMNDEAWRLPVEFLRLAANQGDRQAPGHVLAHG